MNVESVECPNCGAAPFEACRSDGFSLGPRQPHPERWAACGVPVARVDKTLQATVQLGGFSQIHAASEQPTVFTCEVKPFADLCWHCPGCGEVEALDPEGAPEGQTYGTEEKCVGCGEAFARVSTYREVEQYNTIERLRAAHPEA